ncbi:hypothetical protein H6P81_014415 [Aristolochia fimbriata]|uniref:UBR-type domain-containing protein n=1 Tax=Aristolochia fimbriata TaxID=158543 RepID=A0AAV7EL32_ARIFI|nr:hypothetical protein H6P81_014415 [Aristolochia fimbriata]
MAGAFDDEMEGTMTIDEYIEDIEAQELEADLVLGGDEGKECTYSKGYMRRQALFSCLTCTPNGNAGVCTACCLSCHDGHEIIELWTKRNFRCDCGNSKFQEFSCKLYADKEPENTGNNYNQNFKGSYCTCFCPYPDPNAEEQVEMIQCCICEDWFHESHLGLEASEEIPRDEEGEPLYEDFICQDCAMTCSFLKLYPRTIWASATQSNGSTIHTKEENLSEHVSAASASSVNIQADACSLQIPKLDPETSLSIQNVPLEEDTNISSDVVCCHAVANSDITCILGMDLSVASPVLEKKKPMFLAKSWRDLLCRCKTCVGVYAQKGIGYLIDKEDSLEEYEKVAKLKREENIQKQEGVALNLFDNLDHVAKIEILSGIADMKNEFKSFLESHDTSNPITSADVRQVFDNLAKKRQRLQ